jgi:hypothetical protein
MIWVDGGFGAEAQLAYENVNVSVSSFWIRDSSGSDMLRLLLFVQFRLG